MVIKSVAFLIVLLLPYTVFSAGVETKLQISLIKPSDSANGICKSMVETQGYTCEEHKVTTKDGYILSMQRIPTGRSGTTTGARPPVLLQHGILFDAKTWVVNSPDQSLGFILADNGFDVWMPNVRGTEFSRGHTSLSTSDPEYWNWSWDELAAFDLPATVQYVFNQTGQKLHYVGHSLGTLMPLAAFSRNRALNMTRSAGLISPIAYLNQIPSPTVRTAAYAFLAEKLQLLGIVEFSFRAGPGDILFDVACTIIKDCTKLLDSINGPNCCLNSTNSYENLFQPSSTKNFVHLSQSIRRGTVAMYDYGNILDNNKNYGQPTPPAYNLKSIPNNLPLFLAYGGRDFLSGVKDVQTLIADLSDHDRNKLVLLYRDDYAHLDFTLAVNANQVVYNPLIAFLKMN